MNKVPSLSPRATAFSPESRMVTKGTFHHGKQLKRKLPRQKNPM